MHPTSRRLILLAGGATMLIAAPVASAQDAGQIISERPQIFQDLIKCRTIENIEERALCYDKQVDLIDRAEADNKLIVVEQEQVKEARKGLFGFKLPKIKIFGGSADGADDVDEITSSIDFARQFDRGKWRLTLQDGAVWEQLDTRNLVRPPERGDKVVIKRSPLGSYLGKIGNNPTIRVRRVE